MEGRRSMSTLHRPHLDRLAHVLHESRGHGHDGAPLDGYLCNCREYVATLWPEIDGLRDDAFEEGWAGHAYTLEGGYLVLRERILDLVHETLRTLTFWRKK